MEVPWFIKVKQYTLQQWMGQRGDHRKNYKTLRDEYKER